MQRLAIRILSLALIAVSSVAAVETKYPHGGFDPRLDKLQGLLAHMSAPRRRSRSRPVPSCGRPLRPSPVATGVPITSEQEADLRDWLYDFLGRLFRFRQRQPRRPVLPARGRQQPEGLAAHARDPKKLGHPPRRHAL